MTICSCIHVFSHSAERPLGDTGFALDMRIHAYLCTMCANVPEHVWYEGQHLQGRWPGNPCCSV